jgi:CBS domain containing-hemolysin-like protein
MALFLIAVFLTLSISFVCSLMEAMILSTTVGEVEAVKRDYPRKGELLENLKIRLEETISTILTLNTIANTLGSVLVGGLALKLFGDAWLGVFSAVMTISILVFSEVIPKNIGVAYRKSLQPRVARPLTLMVKLLRPVTYLCNVIVRLFMPSATTADANASGDEIILLAQRGAKDGSLTASESNIIANALQLDDVSVRKIMTPRTVVTALRRSITIADVFVQHPNIPFARIPVYGRNRDDIVGLVRRRDLLKAKANDLDQDLVEKHMQEIHFIPETATVANALQHFLKTHQQLLVVVDEFGSFSGVVTMEDVFEQLIGREIFEKDDLAVDMRALAQSRLAKQVQQRHASTLPK